MSEPARYRLERATELALEAGAILLEGYRGARTVTRKGRIDLVTEWDLRSEAFLRARMASAFPEDGLVAEESAGARAASAEGRVWYVDPLDGTTNFAHGHPFFSVSIGLLEGGRPVLGVVHAPALGVTWAGGEGLGVRRDGEPCGVSSTEGLEEALIATGFPYDRATSEENNLREVTAISPKIRGLRRCGSAALDLALVADGTYDGYWEQKLELWDYAGGAALVLAAGGRITDYEGGPIDPARIRVVAANPRLHPALLGAVQAARKK